MTRPSDGGGNQVDVARTAFFERGEVAQGLLDEVITRSWQRCALQHVPEDVRDVRHCSSSELRMLREQNQELITYARPELESLYQQIAHTSSSVILTDAHGVLLYSMGDAEFLNRAERVALQAGACWDELNRGTNAVGTALVERRPVVVHGPEHYLNSNRFLTCSATPILSPTGDLLGVLDVSGDHRSRQLHTIGLVRISSTLIENRLFRARYAGCLMLAFHHRRDYVGALCEGLAAFSGDGILLALNRCAEEQLGEPRRYLLGQRFEALFDLPFPKLMDRLRLAGSDLVSLNRTDGSVLYVVGSGSIVNERGAAYGAFDTVSGGAGAAVPPSRPTLSLAHLDLGDAQVSEVLSKARRVLGRQIAVLIEGETGTGKEVLANALHQAGSRRGGPLVSINCAAVPESLIEAELFGYQPGAFTGANRKGAPGKVLQANGGTLFLDEIGDMPLHLQTRLLRVLQERRVVPLGGTEAIDVDFGLISATNQDIREQVGCGAFRADLYYRLNGLLLRLPPLRCRTDMQALVRQLLEVEAEGEVPVVSERVMQLFLSHPWPGNIRQLANVLRTALAMRDEGDALETCHLPEDFLQDSQPLLPATDLDKSTYPTVHSLQDVAKQAIVAALARHEGNVSAAARSLGISRTTLYRRLKQGDVDSLPV